MKRAANSLTHLTVMFKTKGFLRVDDWCRVERCTKLMENHHEVLMMPYVCPIFAYEWEKMLPISPFHNPILPQCNTHNEDGLVHRSRWLDRRGYSTPHLLDTLVDSSASRLWVDMRFFLRKLFSTDGTQFQLQRKQLKRPNGKATDNTDTQFSSLARMFLVLECRKRLEI